MASKNAEMTDSLQPVYEPDTHMQCCALTAKMLCCRGNHFSD